MGPTTTQSKVAQTPAGADELVRASMSDVIAATVTVNASAPVEEADPREASSRAQNPDSHAQLTSARLSISQSAAEAVAEGAYDSGGNTGAVTCTGGCTIVSGNSAPAQMAPHIAAELAA